MVIKGSILHRIPECGAFRGREISLSLVRWAPNDQPSLCKRRAYGSLPRSTSIAAVAVVTSLIGMIAAPDASVAFPDAHDSPPAGWTGPVFKLSQNYPQSLPQAGARPWRDFNFRDPAEAPQYSKAVLEYCLEGNTTDSFADVSRNPARTWYHAPWLHAGDNGREFIHGLTRERSSRPGKLHPNQTELRSNWAVGFYTPRGGAILGSVWRTASQPDTREARIPQRTVSCKLLFTSATVAEVPYLEDSLEWEADFPG